MHFTSYVCIVTENVENGATNRRVESTSNREGKKNKYISLAMCVLSQRMLRMKLLMVEWKVQAIEKVRRINAFH